jgi:hypothetical protein
MGKPGLVFERWTKHLKTDIHAMPSMAFNDGTKVKKTSCFYIIGDTASATECYVFAHGGSFQDLYVLSHSSFAVPPGITVEFYQPHGYSLAFTATDLRAGNPVKDGSGVGVLQYAAGDTCPNYILAKNQGTHQAPGYKVSDSAQWEMDYTGLQKLAGDLGVVVVTIRNRWFNAGVTLSTLIADVTAAAKGIKVFHCMFCRVKEGSDTWAYTAVVGEEGWQQR